MSTSAEASVLSTPAESNHLNAPDTPTLNTLDIVKPGVHASADATASKQDQTVSERLFGSLQIIGSDINQEISHAGTAVAAAAHQGELLTEGVATGAVLNPINGATEMLNHTVGTNIGQLQFTNQSEVDNSVAGKIGKTAGMIGDFAVLSVATGGVADAVGLTGVAATMVGLGSAGALEGGLLTPTGNSGNFFESRAVGATIGAASGALGGAAGKLLAGATAQIENAGVQKLVAASGSVALGSTLAAGTTEAADYSIKGKPASADDLLWSAALGAAGGAIGAGRALAAETAGGTADTTTAIKPNAETTAGNDAPAAPTSVSAPPGDAHPAQPSVPVSPGDAHLVQPSASASPSGTPEVAPDAHGAPTPGQAVPPDVQAGGTDSAHVEAQAVKPGDAQISGSGDHTQAVPLDNSGRPVSDGNAERIAQAHPPLSPEDMAAQRAALQQDLQNYKGGEGGKSVAQVLADSPLTSDQQTLVLNVLAETRASFLKPGADGSVSEQQQGNYWHTLGELKEGLESAKANGLSPNDTESAALSGILSDSHKVGFSKYSGGGNFFSHHLDGALTTDTILSRYNVDPEIIASVRQAVLEHQISPPNFMSRAYTSEIRAGMKAAGVTPTAADEANIANIQSMIGDPMNSPSVTDASGMRRLDFTPGEQNLLKTYVGDGTQNWYIPNSRAGMVGIAADVFDNYLPETAADGTPIKGPFKIAGLRGPTENPPDLSLDSATAAIKDNMQQSLGLLTPEDQARAAVRIDQADTVYAQARAATTQWLQSSLGITADVNTPYLSRPLTPPPANATAEQMAAWRQSPDVQLGIQIQRNFAEQLLAMRMRGQSPAD